MDAKPGFSELAGDDGCHRQMPASSAVAVAQFAGDDEVTGGQLARGRGGEADEGDRRRFVEQAGEASDEVIVPRRDDLGPSKGVGFEAPCRQDLELRRVRLPPGSAPVP